MRRLAHAGLTLPRVAVDVLVHLHVLVVDHVDEHVHEHVNVHVLWSATFPVAR